MTRAFHTDIPYFYSEKEYVGRVIGRGGGTTLSLEKTLSVKIAFGRKDEEVALIGKKSGDACQSAIELFINEAY